MGIGLIAGMRAAGAMTETAVIGVMPVATMRRGPTTTADELAGQFRGMIAAVILKVVATLTPETRTIPDGLTATVMVR